MEVTGWNCAAARMSRAGQLIVKTAPLPQPFAGLQQALRANDWG